ncbi:hypothetical protein JR338_12795 (plasmid) [Chloroflexota bacterium]|nr:hypothetical protein JR338_12795 [Chloroflexota bacterium]
MKKHIFPFYPFLLAVFPVLALFAYNKFETQFANIFRPLLLTLLFGSLLYGLLYIIFHKKAGKAALLAGGSLLLFFSYGHIFNLIQSSAWLNPLLGRHPYVVVMFGLIWLVLLIIAIRNNIGPDLTKLLNIFGIILVSLPLFQMGHFYLSETLAQNQFHDNPIEVPSGEKKLSYQPDVYYIILDMFTRPDALDETYGIDVWDFVARMTDLGFYYASESESNYGETYTSISTALNMDLIGPYMDSHGIEASSVEGGDLLIHNEVRQDFESMGYQTIAFSTGYRWSEWTDADLYYQIRSTNPLGALTPFENMLYENTLIFPFRGYYLKYLPTPTTEDYGQAGVYHSLHIETQYNILDTLPEIPFNTNPTFTFAHILIPHVPFVFGADGTLLQDPGYFTGDMAGAVNDEYSQDGYTNQVEFISQAIAQISQEIIDNSDNPPIIIIQGDHGWKGANRHQILNLYYFPGEDYTNLNPAITPVNSFRVVLDQFFGFDLPLATDEIITQETYSSDQ